MSILSISAIRDVDGVDVVTAIKVVKNRFIVEVGEHEDSEYKENPLALKKAQNGMTNPDNYDIITNESKTYDEKMKTMNGLLGGTYLTYTPELIEERVWWEKVPACITLSKDIFSQDIKIMCHPDLAPYIIQENGIIKMPGNADVSLAQISHQSKLESTLILGSNSRQIKKYIDDIDKK